MFQVGIAAYSGEPPNELIDKSRRFLRALKLRCTENVSILVGGYWGLMKYVVDEALKLGFVVVVLPPEKLEDIDFPENALIIRTGTSYRVRSVFLVRSADVLIALGGESGSIQEIVTAYTEGKPIFVLYPSGFSTDKIKVLGEYLDQRKTSKIEFVEEPDALADKISRLAEAKGRCR